MDEIREHYNSLLEIQAQLRDHSWSRQLTRYDSEFIARVSTKLQDITNAVYKLTQVPLDLSKCAYCGKKSDGAMLSMAGSLAHADCVIKKLNELLDPDFDGEGEPERVIGFLKIDLSKLKVMEDEVCDEIIIKDVGMSTRLGDAVKCGAQAQHDSIISEIKKQLG